MYPVIIPDAEVFTEQQSQGTNQADSPRDLDDTLQQLTIDMNNQHLSTFFNPKTGFPPEIRDHIYSYVFTDVLDLNNPYETDTHYTRPGYTHKRKTHIEFLLSCKRVYEEAKLFPLKMRMNTFWFKTRERTPPGFKKNDPVGFFEFLKGREKGGMELLEHWHLFVPQYWLEDGSFMKLCKEDVMKSAVDLRITFRRSDWWNWEYDAPLAITPYKLFPRQRLTLSTDAAVHMRKMWKEEQQNPSLQRDFDPNFWGSAFKELPKLKTIIMEFESKKSCGKQVRDIALHAKKWKLPASGGKVFSAEGSEIEKFEWEGPLCMLSASHHPTTAAWRARRRGELLPPEPGPPLDAEGRPVTTKPALVVRVVKWKLV